MAKTKAKAKERDPIARWDELREEWGRPRDAKGQRPLLPDLHTFGALETAIKMIAVLDLMVPIARAANPTFELPLLELAHAMRQADFQSRRGRESFPPMLAKVERIIDCLRQRSSERKGDAMAQRTTAVQEQEIDVVRNPMPELGDAERKTLKALRKTKCNTKALDDGGSTKRARERMVLMALIEACGSGKKTKRGIYRLTAQGRRIADRIEAGE